MPKKKKDLTSFIEAGKKNLEKWKRENPEAAKQVNLRHGIYSKTMDRRFSDLRTRESRALQAVIDGIKRDVGPELDARQSVHLNLLRSKLMIVMRINQYLETVESFIDYESGKARSVIDRTFPTYSRAISRILHELYFVHKSKPRGFKTYDEVMRSLDQKLKKKEGGANQK